MVRIALCLFLAPAAIALLITLQFAPRFLSTVLPTALLMTFMAVMCYRGDPWARWLIILALAVTAMTTVLAVIADDAPRWIIAAQFVQSGAVITLLQWPAARAFLRERRARRLRARPAS